VPAAAVAVVAGAVVVVAGAAAVAAGGDLVPSLRSGRLVAAIGAGGGDGGGVVVVVVAGAAVAVVAGAVPYWRWLNWALFSKVSYSSPFHRRRLRSQLQSGPTG